jgi:hypothetical protein
VVNFGGGERTRIEGGSDGSCCVSNADGRYLQDWTLDPHVYLMGVVGGQMLRDR